ncbi:MAG: hypothetical protein IJ599_01495 [Alphaproteobacteria bacterium]|nr:hypothetical protein [Alphaproteobacteria bacterium]
MQRLKGISDGTAELFFQKAGRIVLICLSAKPSSHAAPTACFSGCALQAWLPLGKSGLFLRPFWKKQ